MPEELVAEDGTVIATQLARARSLPERARGLLGHDLGVGEALLLERAAQVHTFGMRYAIDVVFCDRAWNVRHVVRNMGPSRVTRWVRGARYAVEMRAGTLPAGVVRGTKLRVNRL